MPAEARGHVRKLPSGKWQLRYYDKDRGHRAGGVFPSRTAALNHYRDVIEPELHGRPAVRRDLTFSELVDVFLEPHEKGATAKTITTLRGRLSRPKEAFKDVPLAELEHMTDEIAGFAAKLPDRYRYMVMSAFRQTLEAGVRYGHMTRNPAEVAGRNPPQPKLRGSRVFTPAESKKITKEFDRRGTAAVRFAVATGLRPAEWAAVERKDIDRKRRVLAVRGTKTLRSHREVPLTSAATEGAGQSARAPG
jgi:integrase